MIAEHLDDLTVATTIKQACALLGASRATRYRRLQPPRHGPPAPRPAPPNALSEQERQQVLTMLRSPEYCDLAPAQVWALALGEPETQLPLHEIRSPAGIARSWIPQAFQHAANLIQRVLP